MRAIGIYTSRIQKINGVLTSTICKAYPLEDRVVICDAQQREDGYFERLEVNGENVNLRTISIEELEAGEYVCYASYNVAANDGSWYERLDIKGD